MVSEKAPNLSPAKLGLAVWWPAFWTGVPFKLVFCLLFLSMGVHPWEMPGLAFLLLLSIPIDIWALGLNASTVFLERLRLVPPPSLGLTLWVRITAINLIYLPLAYFALTGTTAGAKAAASAITESELLKALPVAERISVNLVLWGVVSTIVLIILVLIWLSLMGRAVRSVAAKAEPATDSYVGLVRRWDLSRVPADQVLQLVVMGVLCVTLTVFFWMFIPLTTPHPHETYKKDTGKKEAEFKPAEALKRSEKLLAQAEQSVKVLESQAQGALEKKELEEKGKGKGKGKDQPKAPAKDKASPDSAKAAEKPAAAQPVAAKAAGK